MEGPHGIDRALLLRLAHTAAATVDELERLERQPSALTDADWRGAAATAAGGAAVLLRARLRRAAQRARRLHEVDGQALAAPDPGMPTRVGRAGVG